MSSTIIIPHWRNKSLENIREIINGIMRVEKWKDVAEHEGLYQVSSFGRVKSLDRVVHRRSGTTKKLNSKIISQVLLKSGYTKVGLGNEGIANTKYVHRLVAQAFLDNLNNKPEVNHTNGIKHDNRMYYLEWATSSENAQHKFDTGLQLGYWLGKKGKDHHSSKPVNQYDKKMKFIKRWNSVAEAAASLGVNRSSWISACCLQRKRIVKGNEYPAKSAYGFVWRYV